MDIIQPSVWCYSSYGSGRRKCNKSHSSYRLKYMFLIEYRPIFSMYQGVKIQAKIKQNLLKFFERQCVVGEWKVISNFVLRQAAGFTRHTNHVYHLEFVSHTSIMDCDLSCRNMFLELIDFADIVNGSRDGRFLIGNICLLYFVLIS